MASQSIANYKELLDRYESADIMNSLSFGARKPAQAQRRHTLRNLYGVTRSATISDLNSLQGKMAKATISAKAKISKLGPKPSAPQASPSPAAPPKTEIAYDHHNPFFDARMDMTAFMMQSHKNVTAALGACGKWTMSPRGKFILIAQWAKRNSDHPLRHLCRDMAWFSEVLVVGRDDWKLIELADDYLTHTLTKLSEVQSQLRQLSEQKGCGWLQGEGVTPVAAIIRSLERVRTARAEIYARSKQEYEDRKLEADLLRELNKGGCDNGAHQQGSYRATGQGYRAKVEDDVEMEM